MAQIDEASPICRGKNLSWETILLFYNNMPREAMPKNQFHSFTESRINGWTQTHSQIARQLAFYYEKDGMCYPRFTGEISYAELFAYMQNWATNYFIPNPFAPSLKGHKPTCIYRAIVDAIRSGKHDFDNILDGIFGIQLSSHDKVKVYLSNFTNLLFDGSTVSLNDRASGPQLVMEPNEDDAVDAKKYFDFFSSNSSSHDSNASSSLLFQFDDATLFVWECIKLFNKNKELKKLFSSEYKTSGGSSGTYIRINGCYVAQQGKIDVEGYESIFTDEEGYINNGFDAREIENFADAINDVFAGLYEVVIDGGNYKLFKKVVLDEPRQQIFFGAPGTGKSYRVEQITEQYGEDVIRTTFHPDSDYSTFVGCYKPTMQELQGEFATQPILDYDSLVDKFKEYLNVPNVNITKACTIFGYHYHDSIVRMQEQGRRITDLVNDAYKSNTSYDSVVRGGMACYEEELYVPSAKTEIAYSFVPQAFTQAYTRAWLNPNKPIFLVIEELNRGNCAQIFGDIFQLLDRNEKNVSSYSIIPDRDLQQHLADEFKDVEDIPADIKGGKSMRLPANLYIWATMNTSDQSLFPIDSAFKRRWIWKYIPIANAEKGYTIEVGDKSYDWWTFVDKVNNEIEGATKSEDKKLGYFFAKADGGIISADTFVSKVVFYLWNDVFKDSYDKTIFKNGLTFHRFFEPNGDPKIEVVDQFLQDLGLKAIGEE